MEKLVLSSSYLFVPNLYLSLHFSYIFANSLCVDLKLFVSFTNL